jgi:adenylate cyclase 1
LFCWISPDFFAFPAFPKSPFERELQRLLNESTKNKLQQGAVKTNNLDSTKKNGNNNSIIYSKTKTTNAGSLPSSSSGNNNNNNNIKVKDTSDDSCVDTNSLKHPVGLEAIKEMTRNKNPEMT